MYEGIYVITGIPGGGKTTACARQVVKICETIPRTDDEASPVAVCSLTKSAAKEIASRDLPIPEWQVGTLHSMAYRQIGSPPVAEAEASDFNSSHPDMGVSADRDVDDTTGDVLVQNPEAPGNEAYQEYCLCRAEMRPRDQWSPNARYFAKLWEAWKTKNGLVDFCDMIDLAITDGKGHAPGDPSVIVVDEAQDISIQEWQLLRVWYEAAGAIIVSGDPYQSIFEWRGSDASIFFDPAIATDHRKFLNKSYRVPALVRDLSLRWLRDNLSDYQEITYNTRPESGTLGRFSSTTDFPDEVVGFVQKVLSSSESDTVMISASCGYMLRKTIAALRAEGIPFGNRWRRKRGDWNPLKAAPRGRATHFKLMTFYDMVTSKRNGTYADANDILTLLCVEGTLRQGAKTFFKQMAHDAGSSTVLLEDIRNVFLPEAWERLAQAVSADTTGREFCGWVQEHAAAQKAGVLSYDVEVVKHYGFETLLHEPRVSVGTIHCSPGDELVLTTAGYVRIDHLDPSKHGLVAYVSTNNTLSRGKHANHEGSRGDGYPFRVGSRPHCGSLVCIQTERSFTRVTPDHRVRVHLLDSFYGKHVVYLMRRGSWWRIGRCTCTRSCKGTYSGVRGRLHSEQADDGWVLGVYDSLKESLVAELWFQLTYGVPSLCFEANRLRITQRDELHYVHDAIKEISRAGALHALSDAGLLVDHPLYSRVSSGKMKKRHKHNFETVAANLLTLNGHVGVLVPKVGWRESSRHRTIELAPCSAWSQPFVGTVYSISVPPYEHYVSGGAVVHNSFKGAESDHVIMFPDLSQAGDAAFTGPNVRDRNGVVRTFYVGMTRARKTLSICENKSRLSVDIPLDFV